MTQQEINMNASIANKTTINRLAAAFSSAVTQLGGEVVGGLFLLLWVWGALYTHV
jgi:hypothetical protein